MVRWVRNAKHNMCMNMYRTGVMLESLSFVHAPIRNAAPNHSLSLSHTHTRRLFILFYIPHSHSLPWSLFAHWFTFSLPPDSLVHTLSLTHPTCTHTHSYTHTHTYAHTQTYSMIHMLSYLIPWDASGSTSSMSYKARSFTSFFWTADDEIVVMVGRIWDSLRRTKKVNLRRKWWRKEILLLAERGRQRNDLSDRLRDAIVRSNEEEKYLFIHCHHTHKQKIANKFSHDSLATLVAISRQILI